MRPGYRAMLVDRVSSHPICGLRFVTNYTPCQAVVCDRTLTYRGQGVSWAFECNAMTYYCDGIYRLTHHGIEISGRNGVLRVSIGECYLQLVYPTVEFLAYLKDMDHLFIRITASKIVHRHYRIEYDPNPFGMATKVLELVKKLL